MSNKNLKFKKGDHVIVKTVFPPSMEYSIFMSTKHYPKIGWEGTIKSIYTTALKNNKYIIKWNEETTGIPNVNNGDLIKEWMIEKVIKNSNIIFIKR